jgi:large subunit ribosomal protein L35
MPKIKVKKAAAKRFKVTKTGKVMHGKQFGGHLKPGKSKSRQRRLKEPAELTGKFAKKIKQMLAVG